MKANLVLQTSLFSASCFFLLWFCAWMVRFPLPRELFATLLAVLFLGAEVFAGYLVLRQLWRWSGRATEKVLKLKPAGARQR